MPFSPLQPTTDVVFLLDASQRVLQEVYTEQKEFVKRLANHFNINTSGPRGSVIIYAENTYTVARFSDSRFEERIDRAPRLKEMSRRMDLALQSVAQVLVASGRDGRKIVVLLTTGKQFQGGKTISEAIKPLQRIGAQTFVVAIGDKPQVRELYSVVNNNQDIFQVARFSDLRRQARPISRKIRDKPSKLFTANYHSSVLFKLLTFSVIL